MRDRDLARPDAPVLRVHLDLRDHGDDGVSALRVGDSSAVQNLGMQRGLVMSRHQARGPAHFLGGGLHHCGVSYGGDVTQAELDRIRTGRQCQLVDELLAAEVNLRPERIAQVRGSKRRASIEQRRHDFPGEQLGIERVTFGRTPETRASR